MVNIDNFIDNPEVEMGEQGGPFQIIQYRRDLSCSPDDAQVKWYMAQMGVKKKQILCTLNKETVILQAGAMQWFAGDIQLSTGVKGVGDFFRKSMSGSVTGESGIKPEYKGSGLLVTEPSYKYYLVEDLSKWGSGMVVQDGLFAAAQGSVQLKTVARSTLSSAVAGKEGLFNLCMSGKGYVVLEADAPRNELIVIELQDDVVKIDGPFAIAWSSSLNFTVERSSKTLIGSAATGEGLVNVYRGTGRILMMPQV